MSSVAMGHASTWPPLVVSRPHFDGVSGGTGADARSELDDRHAIQTLGEQNLHVSGTSACPW
jgi:hypothetical protein